VEIVNLYIPAGGDTPDPEVNPKFGHKLDFYARLTAEMRRRDPRAPLLLAGDFNIAPGENDVWNHRHMLKVVSHTPVEIETAERLRATLDFTDLARACTPKSEKLFSWWSYRALDHLKSNRGLRLDHLWASPGLVNAAWRAGPLHCRTHHDIRGWTQPSDHVPVTADLVL
jgi:exodeoxyribonuclease-3